MTRNMYGATSADFTITSGGRVIPGAVLTLWTARTGGTQITDLLDVDSVACTTVTSAADGSVVYYGPDGDNELHWADSGQGSRVAIRPTVTDIMDHSIQDEDIAVGADIDPTKIAGTAAVESAIKQQSAGGSRAVGKVHIINSDVNAVASDLGTAAILGGGSTNYENVIGAATTDNVNTNASNLPTATGTEADWSVIVAGYDNVVNGWACVVAGYHNKVEETANHCTISGGSIHEIGAGVDYGTIGGGTSHEVTGDWGTVGGGVRNEAGQSATVAGGIDNTASDYAAIAGGVSNAASAAQSTVAGGIHNTASGISSAVGGGQYNTASGTAATVVGGRENTASGPAATAIGREAKADQETMVAFGGGKFAANGDAQGIKFVARRQTTNGTASEVLLNAAQRMVVPDQTTWAFTGVISARRTDADNESAGYQISGVIDRNTGNGTVALVGTPTVTVLGEDTPEWDVAVSADTGYGSLKVAVTGEASKTINWVAFIDVASTTG